MPFARSATDTSSVTAGLIGAGIQASLTPALHMQEGAEQGLGYRYELFDLDRIEGGPAALAVVRLPRHAREAWARYHAADGTLVLVRPDGYVLARWPRLATEKIADTLTAALAPFRSSRR